MEPPAKHMEEEPSRVAVAQICLAVGYRRRGACRTPLPRRHGRPLCPGPGPVGRLCRRRSMLDRRHPGAGRPQPLAGFRRRLRPDETASEIERFEGANGVRSIGGGDPVTEWWPIRRESVRAGISPSFAQMGREPPLRHVPCWLPCFPESWGRSQRGGQGEGGGDSREPQSWERSRRGEDRGGDGREREGKRDKVRVSAAEREKGDNVIRGRGGDFAGGEGES